MSEVFDWRFHETVRIVTAAVCSYAAIVFLLGVSGKRTVSKWNSFDLIVTVALGSTLSTAILSKDLALPGAVAAFVALIALQYVITWGSVRSRFIKKGVRARPSLLLSNGQFNEETIRAQRITRDEVRAAIRARGLASIDQVQAVVLETDGSFSVINKIEAESASALSDVQGWSS